MTVDSEDYKLEILQYAVNQSIDRLLPNNSEDALSIILYQDNEIIWRVATDIYTNSGYQVDFVFIKDILNLRIKSHAKTRKDYLLWVENYRRRKQREGN